MKESIENNRKIFIYRIGASKLKCWIVGKTKFNLHPSNLLMKNLQSHLLLLISQFSLAQSHYHKDIILIKFRILILCAVPA